MFLSIHSINISHTCSSKQLIVTQCLCQYFIVCESSSLGWILSLIQLFSEWAADTRKAYCQYLGDILTLETIFSLPDTWFQLAETRFDSPVLQPGQGSAKLDSPCAEVPVKERTLTSPSQLLCTFPCFLTRAALLFTLVCVRNRRFPLCRCSSWIWIPG